MLDPLSMGLPLKPYPVLGLVCRGVTPEQANLLFQNFKVLETTKSYKSFLATGSTDPAKVGRCRPLLFGTQYALPV